MWAPPTGTAKGALAGALRSDGWIAERHTLRHVNECEVQPVTMISSAIT